ncbi:hypothetical protein EK21DRAFT_95258, partial [Setomelanomma holmii]
MARDDTGQCTTSAASSTGSVRREQRRPNVVSLQGSNDCERFAAAYVQSSRSRMKSEECDEVLRKFAGNLAACTSNVTLDDLRRYTTSRTRLDLEQAAAVVSSAFVTEGRLNNANQLVQEVGQLLRSSCMWIDPSQQLPESHVVFVRPINLARKVQSSQRRCLRIPEWMFEEAGIAPPEHFRAFFANRDRTQHPNAPRKDDSIIVSRQHFRVEQRHISHYYRYWEPTVNFRKRVKILEDEVIFGRWWLHERVLSVNDVGVLSNCFFILQRRLQRKAVGFRYCGFFAKGEGAKYYQNNLSMKSTFENRLLEIAEANEEGVIVAMGSDDTMKRIDKACLLMKRYVDVYGGGVKESLTFKRGVSGGSGR